MAIELSNESNMAVNINALVALAKFVLCQLDIDENTDLSITLVDEDTMAELHERWMNLPGPTDVMSFPMDELTPGFRQNTPGSVTPHLGDVVICPKFAQTQAIKAGHSSQAEYDLLLVHGILHLLGYDHATEMEKTKMFRLQKTLLIQWSAENQSMID